MLLRHTAGLRGSDNMLPFRTVKHDIKQGYEYLEYESYWHSFIATTIIESRFEKVTLHLQDKYGSVFVQIPFDEFLSMSYSEYRDRVNGSIYYNYVAEAE